MEIKRTQEEVNQKLQELLDLSDNTKDETKQVKIWSQIYFIQWLEGKREGTL